MARDTPVLTTIERRFDEVVVLDVVGRITVETGAHGLPDYVRHHIEAGSRGVALNLRDVKYCDTGGVAALLRCLTLADARGSQLVLIDVQPRVEEILSQMGLLQEFPRFTNETVALTRLRQV